MFPDKRTRRRDTISPCYAEALPTTTDTVAAYRCFIKEFFNGRELPAADYLTATTSPTTSSGSRRPRESTARPASIRSWWGSTPRSRITFRIVVEPFRQDDLIAGQWRGERTSKTGEPVAFLGKHIARVRGGKISEYWDSTIILATDQSRVPPDRRRSHKRNPAVPAAAHNRYRPLILIEASLELPTGRAHRAHRRGLLVDGLITSYLEAGEGDPLVLLHGGEFGCGAEFGWEMVIDELAADHRVIAPDLLGFGQTAKVLDFVDGRAMRLRHLARFCEFLDITAAPFVGNSMGGLVLVTDASSPRPRLPATSIVNITGGGPLERNEHVSALFEYDGSLNGMRDVVHALFAGERWPEDEVYVGRRHAASIAPGAWEAIAAARFRRPTAEPSPSASRDLPYETIEVPVLVIEGEGDKLKPSGWAVEMAARIPDGQAAVVPRAGHCPQIEQPDATLQLIRDHLRR